MILILPPFPICLNACLGDATAHCARDPNLLSAPLTSSVFLQLQPFKWQFPTRIVQPISMEIASLYFIFMVSALHLI